MDVIPQPMTTKAQTTDERQQAALKVKQKVEIIGGKFLGVVINQRKYFIPNWIYRRL